MARSRTVNPSPNPTAGLAFLLSQVGSHAAAKFAERLEPLGLKPAHAGILRVIKQADGLSQQALGETLGLFPSRLVAVLDELERRGLVERRGQPDRQAVLRAVLDRGGATSSGADRRVAREHQAALCAALDESEQGQLAAFLTRIAAEQGLAPGVHPGLRKLGGAEPK